MMQFAEHLHRKGLAPRSIQGRMAVLAFYAKVQECKGYVIDFRISKMIEGWSKERGSVKDSRSPFSPAILIRLVNTWHTICRDHFEASLFKAAMVIVVFQRE